MLTGGFRGLVVAKHDTEGNLAWAKGADGSEAAGSGIQTDAQGNVFFGRVAIDTIGNCYFTGSFQGASFEFDGITVTNAGNLTAFVTKLETTTPPPLTIATSGNFVTLAWSALAENFYIESTPELGPAMAWSSNEVAISTVNLSNVVTMPLSGARTFYRLKRP